MTKDETDLINYFSDFGIASEILSNVPLWEASDKIADLLKSKQLDENGNFIHPDAKVHPTAIIKNSYIDAAVSVHDYVNIRDSIICNCTVVGHCSEINKSIVLNNCSIPRFNYIGWSVIGNNVRLGGCVSLASRRFDDKNVSIKMENQDNATNKQKFGSIVGDNCILGFSVHCNPGTVIGSEAIIMPQVELSGSIPSNHIVSLKQQLICSPKRNLSQLGLNTIKRNPHG